MPRRTERSFDCWTAQRRKYCYTDLVDRSTATNALEPRDDTAFRLHAELCKVLTDPKRLLLIDALRDAERCVGELAQQIGMSLPNASQHLSVLRHAGLVAARREGTTVHYRLIEPRIAEACDIVHQIVADRRAGVRGLGEEYPAVTKEVF